MPSNETLLRLRQWLYYCAVIFVERGTYWQIQLDAIDQNIQHSYVILNILTLTT